MSQVLDRPKVTTKIAQKPTAAKAAWLKERQTYVGATDAGAILGVNPYVSPHDVWLQKKGLAVDSSNIAMRHGTYIEKFIAMEYQATTGVKCRASRLYRHPTFGFCACNPDREITAEHNGAKLRGLLECKSVGHFASKNFGQDGSDQIPEHYLMQVLWQLIISRVDFVHLAALVDNRELRIFTYTLNPELSTFAHVFPPELVTQVFTTVVRWWKHHIECDNEPLLEGHESDEAWVKAERSTYDNGLKTNTDEATDRECVRMRQAIKWAKKADAVLLERKNRVRAFMASRGADTLESSVGDFTWRTNVKGVGVFNTPFKSSKA